MKEGKGLQTKTYDLRVGARKTGLPREPLSGSPGGEKKETRKHAAQKKKKKREQPLGHIV